MAQIVTITNPLTGQPAQVDQLDHTAQQIDDSIGRALPGGGIDTLLAGKAPAGYGLGETQGKRLSATDDLNSIKTPGWYWWPNMPSNAPIGNACMLVYSAYGGECYVQEIHTYLPSGYTWNEGGTIITRQIYATYIGEWEWVNPPMKLGVEYRTTERYMGKPVYVMVVDCGVAPSKGETWVKINKEISRFISIDAVSYADATSQTTLPDSIESCKAVLVMSSQSPYILVKTTTDNYATNGYHVYARIKYTKSTN